MCAYTIRLPSRAKLSCVLQVHGLVTRRFSPVATFTAQIRLFGLLLMAGSFGPSSAQAISFPSGDQAGLKPKFVSRLTLSPVAPIKNMPPPSLSERKATRSPSGEKAGCVSSAGESFVKLMGFFPPTL